MVAKLTGSNNTNQTRGKEEVNQLVETSFPNKFLYTNPYTRRSVCYEKKTREKKSETPNNYILEDGMITHSEKESLTQRIIRVAKASETAEGNADELNDVPRRLFGIEVGAMRRRLGLDVEEVAEKSNIEVDTLFAIELGAASLEQVTDNLHSLGDALGGNYKRLSKLLFNLIFSR